MVNRNKLRCVSCGFAVWTDAYERICARCEEEMIFIEKEFKEKNQNAKRRNNKRKKGMV